MVVVVVNVGGGGCRVVNAGGGGRIVDVDGGVAVVVVVALTLVVAVVWSTRGGCGESGKYY